METAPARASWMSLSSSVSILARCHGDELLGELEHRAHAHADEAVALAIVALAGFEIAPDLFQLDIGLVGPERGNEGVGGG